MEYLSCKIETVNGQAELLTDSDFDVQTFSSEKGFITSVHNIHIEFNHRIMDITKESSPYAWTLLKGCGCEFTAADGLKYLGNDDLATATIMNGERIFYGCMGNVCGKIDPDKDIVNFRFHFTGKEANNE